MPPRCCSNDLDKQKYDDLLVVSPDVGGVVRARAFAKRMECDLAIIDKRRPKANVSEVMNIIGEVEGRTCVIMDDIVDTAGTLCKAADALKEHGAKRVLVLLHPRGLSGAAVSRIDESELDELVVTDTIPLREDAKACPRSARSRSRRCSPTPSCASATRSRSPRCSWNEAFALRRLRRVAASTVSAWLRAGTTPLWSNHMQIEFKATKRDAQGTGASRRLRRAGQIPGIIYGGAGDALPVIDRPQRALPPAAEGSLPRLRADDRSRWRKAERVLRDAQWHPFKQQVLHIDFQRVAAGEKMHLKVPLHFVGDDVAPAVKLGGCMISHIINEIDVQCLPKDLPEFIEVNLSALEAGQSVHVSQIKLPPASSWSARRRRPGGRHRTAGEGRRRSEGEGEAGLSYFPPAPGCRRPTTDEHRACAPASSDRRSRQSGRRILRNPAQRRVLVLRAARRQARRALLARIPFPWSGRQRA